MTPPLRATDEEQRPLLEGDPDDRSTSHEDDEAAKRSCVKNLVLHSASVMLVFVSFISLHNMEWNPIRRQRLETIEAACLYAGTLSVCLLSPLLVRYAGCKWTMVSYFGTQVVYAAVGYHPAWYTSGPASFLVGAAAGPFWTAQGLFLTAVAVAYGRRADVGVDAVVNRFYGLFYALVQSARIWANLLASELVLSPDDVVWNVSYPVNETCGASFCRFPENDAMPLVRSQKASERNILLAVCVGLCLVAVIVKALFVDAVRPLPLEGQLRPAVVDTLMSTVRIHCNGCFLLLIPLIFYNGVEQVLLLDHFRQAFVTCELGVGYIGYVMITYGAVGTISSFMAGQLEKCCGRMLLFLIAAVLNLALLILMLRWNPGIGTKDDWLLYFIPGLWSVSDSVWQTTLMSLIAIDFPHNRDGAFAATRFWQALGTTTAFVYGLHLCMHGKLFVVMFVLCGSVLLYLIMEFYMKHKLNRPYIDLYAPIVD